jgi:hypothetical protein
MFKEITLAALALSLIACGDGGGGSSEPDQSGKIDDDIETPIDIEAGFCGETFILNDVQTDVALWDEDKDGCIDAEELERALEFVPEDPTANAVSATDFITLGNTQMYLSDLRVIGSSPASTANGERAVISNTDTYSIQFTVDDTSTQWLGNTTSTGGGSPVLLVSFTSKSLFDYYDEMTEVDLATLTPTRPEGTSNDIYTGFGEVAPDDASVLSYDLSNVLSEATGSLYCTYAGTVQNCTGQIYDSSSLLDTEGVFDGNLIAQVCSSTGFLAHCESAAVVPVRIIQQQ